MLTPSRTPLHRPHSRPQPRLQPRLQRRLWAAVPLVALGTLTGCSTQTQAASAPPASTPSAAASSPAATTPTPTPAEPTPTPTQDAVTAAPSPTTAPAGPADRLLPGADLPGPSNGFVWTDGATTSRESDNTGGGLLRCNRFTMTDIGAESVVQRRYLPPAGSDTANPPTAAELVADFPDEQTARSAVEVLRSWQRPCDDRLRSFPRHEVGPLDSVSVPASPGADAGWYLLKFGPLKTDPSSLWFGAEGFVRVGDRIALVTMTTAGQSYSYPAGQEPLVTALRNAAARL